MEALFALETRNLLQDKSNDVLNYTLLQSCSLV